MSSQSRWFIASISLAIAIPLAIMSYKVKALGYELESILPDQQVRLVYELQLDGHGEDVRVTTFVPPTDPRQRVLHEENRSPGLHLEITSSGANRVATWTGAAIPDGAKLELAIDLMVRPVVFELDPTLTVPASYPESVQRYLAAEPDIQAQHPEIVRSLASIGADRGPLVERLRKIYELASGLEQRAFKGTTDALTALRLGEASCNGKSRLFVALARAAGIPARLVGGMILESGAKKTSHQWVEAYVAGHWVAFCPTNHHFAELPGHYVRLYTGDETLFRHTADINFDYRFRSSTTLVPSERAQASFKAFNVWALFQSLGLPYSLLRTVLMLPVGALVVVLFRNVIGLPTFGTFLPALIAAAAGETGVAWGLTGVALVVVFVALARLALQRLELLHSPTLAILLAAVTMTMLTLSLVAQRFGIAELAKLSVFPIAVLAITAERFYLSLAEHGTRTAVKELAGTMTVIVGCNVVMNSLALQILVSGFPEVLLLVVAANMVLGRWVGLRALEYLRFRKLILAEERGP